MYAILCVLDNLEKLNDVLEAWKGIGIGGVTILESTGLHRVSSRLHIPMRYTFGRASTERGNLTLFAVVNQEDNIRECLEATEAVVGDFNLPQTGIFVAWPLAFSKGISGKQPFQDEQAGGSS